MCSAYVTFFYHLSYLGHMPFFWPAFRNWGSGGVFCHISYPKLMHEFAYYCLHIENIWPSLIHCHRLGHTTFIWPSFRKFRFWAMGFFVISHWFIIRSPRPAFVQQKQYLYFILFYSFPIKCLLKTRTCIWPLSNFT